jgi:hypothetical protein
MNKVQTHRYSLKYKKNKYANWSVMVCCQFFFIKSNRLFLIRDAKFKTSQKKKNHTSNSKFSTLFFSGGSENKINFYINTEKQ